MAEPRQRKNIRELWDSVVDSLRFWYEDFVGTDIYHKGVEQRVTYEFPFKFSLRKVNAIPGFRE